MSKHYANSIDERRLGDTIMDYAGLTSVRGRAFHFTKLQIGDIIGVPKYTDLAVQMCDERNCGIGRLANLLKRTPECVRSAEVVFVCKNYVTVRFTKINIGFLTDGGGWLSTIHRGEFGGVCLLERAA